MFKVKAEENTYLLANYPILYLFDVIAKSI